MMTKNVYKISDLINRKVLDAGCNQPARLAVIGSPVAHSASPAMQQAALDAMNVDARYIRIEVKSEEVSEAIAKMKNLGFLGCNVTIPHKLEVMNYCDIISPDALALGAVNTIIFGNKTLGTNTDALGFEKAIFENFHQKLSALRVMIIGVGGGAGRAIAAHCARTGCPNLYLVNRTLHKAQSLALTMENYMGQIITMSPSDPDLKSLTSKADLIVNATSLGLKTSDPPPLPLEFITDHHLVYDMVYNQSNTPLISHAKSAGAKTANGLSMLLHQGALAYKHWFPQSEPLEHMRTGLYGNR